ncbi:hypothetical protein VNI00_011392 [Paramarasmius palmivorus]|uniref:Uncharacterized protein n=1 Tax=Paramarasmius palmivorus TaxID=297713 RepID=A0AAW0CB83_9AGAR
MKTRNIIRVQWLRIPSTRRSSVPRHHPYRRPIYSDQQDAPYEPRVEDDSLLYMIQVTQRQRKTDRPMQAIVGQEEEDKDQGGEHVEDGNYGLVVGVILLLDFLFALLLLTRQVLLLEFLYRTGRADDAEE